MAWRVLGRLDLAEKSGIVISMVIGDRNTLTLTAYRNARPLGRAAMAKLEQSATSRLPFMAQLYLATTVLPILFNVGSLTLSVQRLLLLLVAIPLTLNLVRGKYGRLIWTDVFFFLHIAWTTLAIAVNNPDRVIQNAGSTGIEFLGGYLVGRAYIRSTDDFIALARFLIFLVCCMLPFALFETVTGHPILIELLDKLPGISGVTIVNIEARMGLERVQAVFAHPIHFGLFCGSVFSLAFIGLKGLATTAQRYMVAAVIGICVFLSLSSGALLPLLLQIFFIGWAFLLRGVRYRWLVLLSIFALLYIAIDLISNRTPMKVFMTYATFSAHNAYWRGIIFEWGMINVWGSPYFGIGLKEWVRPFFMRSGSIDNFWLVNAVRYGIPGFALLMIGYLPPLWWVGRRNFEEGSRIWLLRRAWVFTFAGLTLTLCTVHVWTSVYSFVFFLFGAGMWFLTAETASSPQNAVRATGIRSGRKIEKPKLTGLEEEDVASATLSTTLSAQRGILYSRFTAQKPNR